MKNVKSKASRFFKALNKDEQVANDENVDFNAGIDGGEGVKGDDEEKSALKKKRGGREEGDSKEQQVRYLSLMNWDWDWDCIRISEGSLTISLYETASRFFKKKDPNTMDRPPLPTSAPPPLGQKNVAHGPGWLNEGIRSDPDFNTCPAPPPSDVSSTTTVQAAKKSSGFATLRTKTSRFFRPLVSSSDTPPVPSTTRPYISRSILQPHSDVPNSPLASIGRTYKPVAPAPNFIRPTGPTPPRPARPDSLDSEIVGFMKDTTTRVSAGTKISSRNSGLTHEQRGRSSTLSRRSIEARLGLPSVGHVSMEDATPAKNSPLCTRSSPLSPSATQSSHQQLDEYSALERGRCYKGAMAQELRR
ncbi:hypothetical protein K504DRAFT_486833 [Pleomassaria siparia CBS 279.74]|uniref:Uncharacterized protein n=1 Tax=Pleomassaria siparia CBS 279.74 TaxID=1314801 RepID=A0A6G1KQD9_9PLEO|nr:hypothetical protein K504DRAFT_486833 [Pleomassaria siparia CBS 279.74]